MWSRTAVTWREAVPVAPSRLPVTVWMPAAEAVQVAARQEPSGEIENAALDVTSPRELLYWSRPCAVYACEPPEAIVAEAGASTRWSGAPGLTLNDAVPVLPPALPVTVWAPEGVAVQVASVQDPFGPIENVVLPVTSPSELFEASKPSAVYACEPPAPIDALEGPITM